MNNTKVALGVGACVLTALMVAWGQAKYPEWPYPMSYDSVKAAPQNNKLLYEDNKLRFIEVTVKPGEQEPMNGQPYPSVYLHDSPMPDAVQIADAKLDPSSPLNGQGAGHGTAPAGLDGPTCDTMPPLAPHQIYNHSSLPIHFYILEFKRLDGADLAANWKTWYPWMVPPIPTVNNLDPSTLGPPFSKEWPYPIAMDSVSAAPNNHKALYSDERVRLIEVTERPESEENLHGHPYRSVFIYDTATAAPPPNTDAGAPAPGPAGGAAGGRGATSRTPLGTPGPYHKGETGDYLSDPNQIPMGRGGAGRPPAGMQAPSCSAATPQAPHAHINGGETPGHFYRVEFLREDWRTKYR
jgi:hypothetical protein